MKIFRGPLSNNDWFETGKKTAKQVAKDWMERKKIQFNGNIDKLSERRTVIGVEIEDSDIIELSGLLMRKQEARISSLESEAQFRKEALRKIESLVRYHRENAPSHEELLDAIGEIASHFCWRTPKSKITLPKWIKWQQL